MTEKKVVSIEQSAGFLRSRALKQKRAGHPLEALELLRRANDAAPEHEGFWMDMADIYGEMECPWDARRMVLTHLFHRPEDAESFYWLAKYDLEAGLSDEAARAFKQYIRLKPEGDLTEDARSELAGLEMDSERWHDLDRRDRRRLRRLRKARKLQQEQDFSGAERVFAEEQAEYPEDAQIRVSRAMNLYLLGREEDARALMDESPLDDGLPTSTLILAAQVYDRLGDRGKAVRALNGLNMHEISIVSLQMLLCLLTDMGLYEQALEAGRQILQQEPYDRQVLHMMAVDSLRAGHPESEAAGYWQTLLRMEPEDVVARWHLNALRDGGVAAEELSEGYQLPRDEQLRRSQRLLELLPLRPSEAEALWLEDADARGALKWALESEIPQLAGPAAQVLSGVEEESARKALLDFIAGTQLGFDFDFLTACGILPTRHWSREGVQAYMYVRYFMPDSQRLLKEFGVAFRQMVRMADDVLREEYELEADANLALLWKLAEKHQKRFEVVRDLRCGAAALALSLLRELEIEADEKHIAQLFGCSPRKLAYYAAWLDRAQRSGEPIELTPR